MARTMSRVTSSILPKRSNRSDPCCLSELRMSNTPSVRNLWGVRVKGESEGGFGGGGEQGKGTVPGSEGAGPPELAEPSPRFGALTLIAWQARQLDEALVKDVQGQDVRDVAVRVVVCRVKQLVVLSSAQGRRAGSTEVSATRHDSGTQRSEESHTLRL